VLPSENENKKQKDEKTMSNLEPFAIDQYKDLFRNSKAFYQFVSALEKAFESKTTPLLVEGKIVGMAFSKTAAKELLSRQLAQQLAKDPNQLTRLIASLKEEAVDMDDL
jgi:hypothetical protein